MQFWRINGNYIHDRTLTALDVLKHEIDELDNDLKILIPSVQPLKLYKANAITWACMTKQHARRYGNNPESIDADNILIVAADKDNGYLILSLDNRRIQG